MLVVGVTGGIGSGKSTLAALLAQRGAELIDADELGRAAMRPGEPAWHSVVEQFGDEVLAAGTLDIDRGRLAGIVFDDPGKLAALNAIVHPVIFSRVADELDRLRSTGKIVILDAALIVETGLQDILDALIVVTASSEARAERLRRYRGMSRTDATARMGAQRAPEELVSRADIVVHNEGDPADLESEADRVWAELLALR